MGGGNLPTPAFCIQSYGYIQVKSRYNIISGTWKKLSYNETYCYIRIPSFCTNLHWICSFCHFYSCLIPQLSFPQYNINLRYIGKAKCKWLFTNLWLLIRGTCKSAGHIDLRWNLNLFRRDCKAKSTLVWRQLSSQSGQCLGKIEGLRTKKVKKHKRVLSRKVKKHIFHIFQYGHFCFQRTYQGNVWRRKLKFAKSVLFYHSCSYMFVLFYLSCPEPFNYLVSREYACGNTELLCYNETYVITNYVINVKICAEVMLYRQGFQNSYVVSRFML